MAKKEVNFRIYCRKCKYYPLSSIDEPCNECLTYGHNEDSHKPVKYTEKERTYGRESKGKE